LLANDHIFYILQESLRFLKALDSPSVLYLIISCVMTCPSDNRVIINKIINSEFLN
jgi:hypothetical protein